MLCGLSKLQFGLVALFLIGFHVMFNASFGSDSLMHSSHPVAAEETHPDNTAFDSVPVLNSKVAWAIPVGGKTKRVHILDRLLGDLLKQGAGRENIYIFEDNGSRNFKSDPDLTAKAQEYGVNLMRSNIERLNRPEDRTAKNFGLYLARHYHFMMEFLMVNRGQYHDHVVIIEDDLVLAPDAVKYFVEMAHVMDQDDTVYCVSAHTDNAFPVLASQDTAIAQSHNGFEFRRGEHFMAPGWMTSRRKYVDYLRPTWFDENGELPYQDEHGMGNANWDMYMEVRVGKMECIFPKIPRVSHQGGGGFTVSKEQQMQLFGNLQLATLPPSAPWGKEQTNHLVKSQFDDDLVSFMSTAIVLGDVRELSEYRGEKIVLLMPATHAAHAAWSNLFNGYWQVTSIGGHAGHGKMRAVHEGTVLVEWLGNLVLVVAKYSPLLDRAQEANPKLKDVMSVVSNAGKSYAVRVEKHGCFHDKMAPRDLPFSVHVPTRMSPESCMAECHRQNFVYAGVQNGDECWCGDSFGVHGEAPEEDCSKKCGGGLSLCGGPLRNSIYSVLGGTQEPPPAGLTTHPVDATRGLKMTTARVGESCTNACLREGKVCDVSLMPLLTDNRLLKELKCTSSTPNFDSSTMFASPAMLTDSHQCLVTSNRYMSCQYEPDANKQAHLQRLCSCVNAV